MGRAHEFTSMLDVQTIAQLESLARKSHSGRSPVYMSTDDARALLAAAPQPSPEPKGQEHAHDWRFSLQDHVYKCDCGATRGDYPFGAASFKD